MYRAANGSHNNISHYAEAEENNHPEGRTYRETYSEEGHHGWSQITPKGWEAPSKNKQTQSLGGPHCIPPRSYVKGMHLRKHSSWFLRGRIH